MSLRSVYADSSQLDPVTVEYHTAATAAGMQVRCARTVPTRMLVFDRTAGIIPAGDNGESAVLVRGEALAAILVLSFEQLWEKAEPFRGNGNQVTVSREEIDPSDRSLLRLLSLGVKDEAAARHLASRCAPCAARSRPDAESGGRVALPGRDRSRQPWVALSGSSLAASCHGNSCTAQKEAQTGVAQSWWKGSKFLSPIAGSIP